MPVQRVVNIFCLKPCTHVVSDFIHSYKLEYKYTASALISPSLLSLSSLTPIHGCPPQLLSSGQYYTIALELELPESPVNEEIGVFMVNITFYTTEGRFLSTSARPVRKRKRDIFCSDIALLKNY